MTRLNFKLCPYGRMAALLLSACAFFLVCLGQGWAQPSGAERPREALVKAAFLHKFFSFVEWPDGAFAKPDSSVRIGVLGDDDVLRDLLELSKDRGRDGRQVTPVRLLPGEPITGIHILYVKAGEGVKMADVLASVPPGVLTVADAESAHPKGSVMSFFLEDGRVRFGLSMEAAARQGLRLNSRLLSVARKIQGSIGFSPLLVHLDGARLRLSASGAG